MLHRMKIYDEDVIDNVLRIEYESTLLYKHMPKVENCFCNCDVRGCQCKTDKERRNRLDYANLA